MQNVDKAISAGKSIIRTMFFLLPEDTLTGCGLKRKQSCPPMPYADLEKMAVDQWLILGFSAMVAARTRVFCGGHKEAWKA